MTQTWQDLPSFGRKRFEKEGDGTRGLDYDEIRDKFKDRLSAGELAKLIEQVQKLRGERNRNEDSRKRGGGFPFGPSDICADDDEENQ